MGSEQSSAAAAREASSNARRSESPRSGGRLVRGHTIAASGCEAAKMERPTSISPGPSVCSDADLPYISYTVNRPIGDSPKLKNKNLKQPLMTRSRSTGLGKNKNQTQGGKYSSNSKQPPASASAALGRATKAHNIVVVKSGAAQGGPESDPDIQRLQSIPMFLPVMRGTLNLPSHRDPEVLERLQPAPLRALCLKMQAHYATRANDVATEQNNIVQKIKETDADINRLMAGLTDNQKRYAKYAEKLSKVHDVSHQVKKCHMLLSQTLESLNTLNNCLPLEDRLEPFFWSAS
ncbi:BLOC-1-related complex subunit 5-like [Ctenocephalides felis]|uniref:BLOC-1-related complex subunit 5-like n=1 Tax=Ctenocephalides felis TaxID=7515 RepID=UPI000E6E1CDE|nr:BLOC-1-related complex subunit 5-like [Ctenocephalides felis]